MSTDKTAVAAFVAGILAANALPHAYAGAAGATHLTPLAGRSSGPGINLAWALVNAGASTAIIRSALDPSSAAQRRAFKGGVLAFSAWVLASEWVTDFQ